MSDVQQPLPVAGPSAAVWEQDGSVGGEDQLGHGAVKAIATTPQGIATVRNVPALAAAANSVTVAAGQTMRIVGRTPQRRRLTLLATDTAGTKAPGPLAITQEPAAGTEVIFTVPAGTWWDLETLIFTLVTSGTVANRRPHILIDDGAGNVLWNWTVAADQTAGTTVIYSGAVGVTEYSGPTGVRGGVLAYPLPRIVLAPGWRILTSTTNIQAGDDYSAVVLGVATKPASGTPQILGRINVDGGMASGGGGSAVGVGLAVPRNRSVSVESSSELWFTAGSTDTEVTYWAEIDHG